MKKQNRKHGFTLVELLVVIAILAILATVSVVGYTAFINKARQSNCDNEAHQVEEAINATLMIPDAEYVIATVSGAKYVIKSAKVTSDTESGNEFVAIWKITTSDGKETIALASSDEVKAAFAASEDFGDLAKKGNFTVDNGNNVEGNVIIIYTYIDYPTIKHDIVVVKSAD